MDSASNSKKQSSPYSQHPFASRNKSYERYRKDARQSNHRGGPSAGDGNSNPVETLTNLLYKPQVSSIEPEVKKSMEKDKECVFKFDQPWQCVVCVQQYGRNNSDAVYAIGPCDHLVCYRCSTKMRVLCEQSECPICRQEIPEVS